MSQCLHYFHEPRVVNEFVDANALGRHSGEHVTEGTLAIVGQLQIANIALDLVLNFRVVFLQIPNH